jgi:chorismate lyase/3-hydroxybenzoate synthase
VPLDQLGYAERAEVWLSPEPVAYGSAEGLSFAMSDAVILVSVSLPEDAESQVEALTERAYDALLGCVRCSGYKHLLRMWNYFPGITDEQAGMERYQRFSVGRQAAFARHGVIAPPSLPAASAMGTRRGAFQVYALAARGAATAIENPRQVSAYRYPKRYGPTSPSFSRAMLKDWDAERHLYVSGTASIVGHESQHLDEGAGQEEETRRNLQVLLESAAARCGLGPARLLPSSTLKVYSRKPEPSMPALGRSLTEVWGQKLPALFIEADLCRAELLIEVEAVLRFSV